MFRASAVGNLRAFFERFRHLGVRPDPELEALVARAQGAVRGVGAQELRDGPGLRREVATRLERVRARLDGMLADRPRRRILRKASTPGVATS